MRGLASVFEGRSDWSDGIMPTESDYEAREIAAEESSLAAWEMEQGK